MTTAACPSLPDGVHVIGEQPAEAGDVPLFRHPRWVEAHPWLEQGITGRGAGTPFDMGLFGAAAAGAVAGRWRALRAAVGFPRAVHARQIHEATVLHHDSAGPGMFIADDADGHVTGAPRVLLTVSVADCVPISLVAADARAVALLHAGWRGVAAGVLEAGVATLARRYDVPLRALEVHFGPAICGACFEVGPEVPRALGLPPAPDGTRADDDDRARVDLRAALAARARRLGVPAAAMTVSSHCTRCGTSDFFSHRGGERERQVAILGVRDRRQP